MHTNAIKCSYTNPTRIDADLSRKRFLQKNPLQRSREIAYYTTQEDLELHLPLPGCRFESRRPRDMFWLWVAFRPQKHSLRTVYSIVSCTQATKFKRKTGKYVELTAVSNELNSCYNSPPGCPWYPSTWPGTLPDFNSAGLTELEAWNEHQHEIRRSTSAQSHYLKWVIPNDSQHLSAR